ncbi:hypothetical protein [Draconibacterium mangrovi]|uniref:hypothetical protein n=1 Tax=Draconibacterium mangrovi TaxID=2697469 RepID=UPI0013D3955C|nr:hypothetical protein [Draconibacterium mangrovi]
MKNTILIIVIALLVSSCDKDETVNMSLLQEYSFVFEAYRDYRNIDLGIDEFFYSFDVDSVTISGPRYELIDEVRTPKEIVQNKWPYFIEGNTIYFTSLINDNQLITLPELISPVPYRHMQWKVLSLDDQEMKVDIISNSMLAGHAEFRVEK